MVYSNKFVVCVMVNGSPQKELANGTVLLPFGASYSLRFKNKNNRRAVVDIYIDGEKVSGNGYVIEANSHTDISRHFNKDRAFKFVSLDSGEAVEAGKNGSNDDKTKGLIEARFRLEKEKEKVKEVHHWYPVEKKPMIPYPYGYPWYDNGYRWVCSDSEPMTFGSATNSVCDSDVTASSNSGTIPYSVGGAEHVNQFSLCSRSILRTCNAKAIPQDGCTVEGEATGQTFGSAYVDLESNETVLKIFLQGIEVEEVVKTNSKKKIIDLQKEISDLEEIQKLEEKLAALRKKVIQ